MEEINWRYWDRESVSECYFWHQLTQVVLDKGPLKELLMLLMLLRDGTVTHHCSVLYLWVCVCFEGKQNWRSFVTVFWWRQFIFTRRLFCYWLLCDVQMWDRIVSIESQLIGVVCNYGYSHMTGYKLLSWLVETQSYVMFTVIKWWKSCA